MSNKLNFNTENLALIETKVFANSWYMFPFSNSTSSTQNLIQRMLRKYKGDVLKNLEITNTTMLFYTIFGRVTVRADIYKIVTPNNGELYEIKNYIILKSSQGNKLYETSP